MKIIKLTGREQTVLKAIDFSNGTPGDEILKITRLERGDFVDIVNGLMDVGYVECSPYKEHVSTDNSDDHLFEVNPSYALELRKAMRKNY